MFSLVAVPTGRASGAVANPEADTHDCPRPLHWRVRRANERSSPECRRHAAETGSGHAARPLIWRLGFAPHRQSSSPSSRDRRRGRRAVANHLDDYLSVLGPNEMRLFRRLREEATGGQPLHLALVELLAVAHEQSTRENGHNPLVGVEMRLDLEARREPRAEDIDPGLLRITGNYRLLEPHGIELPRELIRRHPHRLQRVGLRGGGDEQRENGTVYNSAKVLHRSPLSNVRRTLSISNHVTR